MPMFIQKFAFFTANYDLRFEFPFVAQGNVFINLCLGTIVALFYCRGKEVAVLHL
jgi:hypothetical protein